MEMLTIKNISFNINISVVFLSIYELVDCFQFFANELSSYDYKATDYDDVEKHILKIKSSSVRSCQIVLRFTFQ